MRRAAKSRAASEKKFEGGFAAPNSTKAQVSLRIWYHTPQIAFKRMAIEAYPAARRNPFLALAEDGS